MARPAEELDARATEAFFDFIGPAEIKIKGHRVWLEHVLLPYRDGHTIEELRRNFPTLRRSELAAAIRYYELNRQHVDHYLDAAEAWSRETRRRQQTEPDEALAGFIGRAGLLRERLAAERSSRPG